MLVFYSGPRRDLTAESTRGGRRARGLFGVSTEFTNGLPTRIEMANWP